MSSFLVTVEQLFFGLPNLGRLLSIIKGTHDSSI
jgi:hypothetical protein